MTPESFFVHVHDIHRRQKQSCAYNLHTYYLSTYLHDPNQIMTWKWQHAQSARIFRARKETKGRTGTNIFKVI